MTAPLFSLGRTVATPGVLASVSMDEIVTSLGQHTRGSWGELTEDDRKANDRALRDGDRLVSVYRSTAGTKYYVITEWDRSVTTVLLPEEY